MHFTISGVKKIFCYIKNFVIERFVLSRFHCNSKFGTNLYMNLILSKKRDTKELL